MRKHIITVYTNDENDLFEILNEIRFEIDRKVFTRDNIRQRKFFGTWEMEVDSSLCSRYEKVAKWESNIVPDSEFIKFQQSTEL